MHCVLIRPAYRNSGYDEGTQECLGIGYVGAVLRQHGHQLTVIDAELEKLTDEQTVERATAVDPQLIGFSVMSQDAVDSAAVLSGTLRDRLPSAHLTAGGNLASFAPDWIADLCPDLNTIIRFEGERPLMRLVQTLETAKDFSDIAGLCVLNPSGLKINPPDHPLEDLDLLPFPVRDTLPIAMRGGLMPPMSTSRGCQSKCAILRRSSV